MPLPPSGFATLRDAVVFLLGVVILVYATVIRDTPDPVAVGAGITLTGLPLALLPRRDDPPPPSSDRHRADADPRT